MNQVAMIVATTAPSTAPSTSNSIAPSTSSTVPVDGFQPACVERDATKVTSPEGDPALEVAGLLGVAPVVQLRLPTSRWGGIEDTSRVRVWRIPGGMLVELRPYNDGSLPVGALLAVDADGTIRWQRCTDRLPDIVRVAQTETSTEFVVVWETYGPTGLVRTDLEVWSLADGSTSRTWDEALAAILSAQGLAASEEPNGIIIVDSYKNMLDKQSLEPLMTQVVSVNYANATVKGVVANGNFVEVKGTQNSDGTFQATKVEAERNND